MKSLFNSRILLDNISYLLSQENKKVGDLELETGVSKGYISRLNKKEDANPAIDFIMRTAKFFNIDINTLLYIRLSNLTPTEKYLNNFITKLIKDTTEYKLRWNIETADYLNFNLPYDFGKPLHILFEQALNNSCLQDIFLSKTYGYETIINDDCYKLEFQNNTSIYLMNIAHYNPDKNNYKDNGHVIEFWIYSNDDGVKCLGTSKGNALFEEKLDALYRAIKVDSQHIKLHERTIETINDYMNYGIVDE